MIDAGAVRGAARGRRSAGAGWQTGRSVGL